MINENTRKVNTKASLDEEINDTSINEITEEIKNININTGNNEIQINKIKEQNFNSNNEQNNSSNNKIEIKNNKVEEIISEKDTNKFDIQNSNNGLIEIKSDGNDVKNEISKNVNENLESNDKIKIENKNKVSNLNNEKMREPEIDSEKNKGNTKDTTIASNDKAKNEETSTETKQKHKEKEENIYKLKVIEKRNEYQGIIQQKNIITQNINGPCPLLALCNILIIRGDISIPLKKKEITYEEIIDILGDYIARNTGNIDIDNSDDCGFQDVLDIIPTLKKGLDINVKFDSVLAFEPSPAISVFKYFNIKLVHGWTVDPDDKETYKIIVEECGNYNNVVEKIIELDSANNSKDNLPENEEESEKNEVKRKELYHTAIICKNFIESTASQLTYHGLTSIPDILEVGEPTAFFRNNHFLTLIKTPDNNMYTLVTDQGFVNEKKIVWESLSTVDGDSIFVDGLFKRYENKTINNNNLILNSPNEDLDYAIALSLQEEEEQKRKEMLERRNQERIRKSQTYPRFNNSNENIHHQNNHRGNGTYSRKNSHNNNNKYSNTNNSKPKESEEDKCIIM